MDTETRQRIEETVSEILKAADMDSMTELSVRAMAAEKLGLDLSGITYKSFIRNLIESFLLSIEGDDELITPISAATTAATALRSDSIVPPFELERVAEQEPQNTRPNVVTVDKAANSDGGSSRITCDLSKMRHVAVTGSKGKTAVTIADFYENDGDSVPSHKGIIIHSEQWSTFKKSIPAIEEAISTAESSIRLTLERGQNQDARIISDTENARVVDLNSGAELKRQKERRYKPVSSVKKDEKADTSPPPLGLAPIEIIRFDGKNYRQWAARIELLLNQLKVAHVLVDPCPSALGVNREEIGQFIAAAQKWMDNDYICRLNILNSLSDHLFDQYARKSGSAKELWEDLRLIYLHEEHGSKVSLVKKYIEFQIVEGKSVLDQVQEFHEIADSIVASGMFVEEKFHVNIIISKLPPSWKAFSVELMKEEHLPIRLLMNHLKLEEESRGKGRKIRAWSPEHRHMRKLGPHRTGMKRPGILQAHHEPDKERRINKFCNICKKGGHLPEQCWFRKSGSQDGNNNVTPHVVTDANTNKPVQ